MGVPKFYRWLSERYPSVNQVISDLTLLPEFDNLYLDMNGIIHACTHPNDQEVSQQGLTQEEMMKNIWNYVDRIVTQIVKPQKLLYIAVDGVAPRAKMNQQRSRRFRSAKDAREARAEAERKGIVIDEATIFDSNVITPGTEFMCTVDAHLRYFICKKMKEDPLWRRLNIIYSGHSVPGEGEHKIMQYIRDQRASPNYQSNVRHCMYGQDADLIMLALATHEPHFTLLREVIDFGRGRPGNGGRESTRTVLKQTKDASFQLLHVSILREYLEYEFLRDVPEEFRDVERVVDDFVFLTFLVGNDFLPHLPSLDISEHAFDRLFELYGQQFRQSGGREYLVERGEISADKLQAFFTDIGLMEVEIFDRREEDVTMFNARRRKADIRYKNANPSVPSEEELQAREAEAQSRYEAALQAAVKEGKLPPEKALATRADGKKDFRGRYYFEKLEVIDASDSPVIAKLCRTYVEGLAWCLAYYIKGCVSWKWFYPFHYGPLISDVKNLREALEGLEFELGEPFLPFEQLLSCLPGDSAKCLPRRHQFLMTSPTSPIIDFYPKEFVVDMNGKHNPWEGVVLIPFIDEERLRSAIRAHCPDSALTADEKSRNRFGVILQYKHDPSVSVSVASCNAAQFPDVSLCQVRVGTITPSFQSFSSFEPRLVPGTQIPSPGFPSLKVLPISDVRIEALKINVHGTESRYRTLCLSLPVAELPPIDAVAPEILGRTVYVNWPMMHEARIVAVLDGEKEYRVSGDDAISIGDGGGTVPYVSRLLRPEEGIEWDEAADLMQKHYKLGRGVVGEGGLEVGVVEMTIKVRPLQGLARDLATGACKKVFGTHEAEVPIQMAMWTVPVIDPRFIERAALPLQERLPLNTDVIFLEGPHKGRVGTVVGHITSPLEDKPHGAVKVQVAMTSDHDRPIGLLARKTFTPSYYDGGQVMKALNLDGKILGKVTGSLLIDPGNHDIGLNLKVRSKYVLPDYVRKKAGGRPEGAAAWAQAADSVRIVGSAEAANGRDDDGGQGQWEYSEKAVLLLKVYMETFPTLFEQLRREPANVSYDAKRIFGRDSAQELEKIQQWLSQQETTTMPRVPLTTMVLCREAIRAIERASDELMAKNKQSGLRVQMRTFQVNPEQVLACGAHQPSDAPLRTSGRPELGDRVVNLTGLGVPFGLRGTVVALHKHSGCVEVLFDEEFVGGTSLQGTCSPYRGKLLPWSTLLKVTAELPPGMAKGRPRQATDITQVLDVASKRTSAQAGGDAQAKGQKNAPDAPPQGAPVQPKVKQILTRKPSAQNGAPGAVDARGTAANRTPAEAQRQQGGGSSGPDSASTASAADSLSQMGKQLLGQLRMGIGANGAASNAVSADRASDASSSVRSVSQPRSAKGLSESMRSPSKPRAAAAEDAAKQHAPVSRSRSGSLDVNDGVDGLSETSGGGGGDGGAKAEPMPIAVVSAQQKLSKGTGFRSAKGPVRDNKGLEVEGSGFKRSRTATTMWPMVKEQPSSSNAAQSDMHRVLGLLQRQKDTPNVVAATAQPAPSATLLDEPQPQKQPPLPSQADSKEVNPDMTRVLSLLRRPSESTAEPAPGQQLAQPDVELKAPDKQAVAVATPPATTSATDSLKSMLKINESKAEPRPTMTQPPPPPPPASQPPTPHHQQHGPPPPPQQPGVRPFMGPMMVPMYGPVHPMPPPGAYGPPPPNMYPGGPYVNPIMYGAPNGPPQVQAGMPTRRNSRGKESGGGQPGGKSGCLTPSQVFRSKPVASSAEAGNAAVAVAVPAVMTDT